MKFLSKKSGQARGERRRTGSPFWGYVMLATLVILCGVYIHGINLYVVSTLSMDTMKKNSVLLENDVRDLETAVMQVSVGYNLEERAQALGLEQSSGPLHFIRRDSLAVNSH